jgi:hypothetical protein
MRGTTGFIANSDIYVLDKIVQNTAMEAGRNLLIDQLREGFARDRMYRWVPDDWGFSKTPPASGLAPDAGMDDDTTTRLYIGAQYKNAGSFLPAIIVKQNSIQYKPVSINQNKWDFEYGDTPVMDESGRVEYIRAPVAYSFVGLWESNFEIKIISRSLVDTTRLHDIIMIMLASTYRYTLQQSGLFIKEIRGSGEQAETYGSNDPYYYSTISLDTLSEFRRRIPISSAIERIQVCLDMDIIETDLPPASEARIAVEPVGDFRVYFGAESFSLLNATNIESLPFYLQATPAGQYSFTVDPGQFAFFASPARYGIAFSVGYFTEIGSVISDGILYKVYRSNVPSLGTISFEVSL